jgi:hypothetical protein
LPAVPRTATFWYEVFTFSELPPVIKIMGSVTNPSWGGMRVGRRIPQVNRQQHLAKPRQSSLLHPSARAGEVDTVTIFALSSGRSGTLSLCEILKRNAPQLAVEHETNKNLWNPSMFGRAIYQYATGNLGPVRARLRRKRRAVDWCRASTYIETSHAFLKSYWTLAPEYFPQTKVFHLIRHPLQVARSEANRDLWNDSRHVAFRNYHGPDGRRYRHWALTELEPIFGGFDLADLTLFQRYVIQWIEIENRAMDYLQRFDMHEHCLTLHTPHDLNSPQAMASLLDFVGAGHTGELSLPGAQNQTPGYETKLGADELSQTRDVIAALPSAYLDIFQREPYAQQSWVALLTK